MAQSERPRKRRWWLFFLFIGVLFCLPIVGAVALFSQLDKAKPQVSQGTILEIHLRGDIPEAPGDPVLATLTGDTPLSVWGVRSALRRAAKDDRISGVRLVIEPLQMGWAAVEEVVNELDRFQAAGKDIHAFLQVDLLEEKELFLASAADRIWMVPGTGALINGFSMEVLFWRGTLDKLKIEPEVIMFHEYKSAGEPMKNRQMSPEMRESLDAVVGTIQARFMDRMIEKRGVSAETLNGLLAQGLVPAEALLEAGLIDELGYIDQINDLLTGIAKVDEYKGLDISQYANNLSLGAAAGAGASTLDLGGAKVAVIFAEGPIVAASGGSGLFDDQSTIFGPSTAARIRQAIDDPAVDAIVLRVSSPGGSPVGSDLIWRETQRAKEAGKPIVISMSTVAASGGYWISMGADGIVAQPTTITGSIGVIFQKFNINGFLEMVGANADSVSTAPMADLFTLTAPLSPERYALIEKWMAGTYSDFTTKVASGRGLSLDKVQAIAKGRVWSGVDAKAQGLVDELGGLEVAVGLAAQKMGLTAEDVTAEPYPASSPLFERLFGGGLQANALVSYILTGQLPTQKDAWIQSLAKPSVEASMPAIWIH